MPPDPSAVPLTQRPPIGAAPTGVAAFVGRFQHGPSDVAIPLTSREEAGTRLGPPLSDGDAALAVELFFANGGERAYAVRVPGEEGRDPAGPRGTAMAAGLRALAGIDDVEVVCLPDAGRLDAPDATALYVAATAFCEAERLMLLVDPPRDVRDPTPLIDWVSTRGVRHRNAALYVPRVVVADPLLGDGSTRAIAASGAVAGVYARTDRARGVWKSPAGTDAILRGIAGLEAALLDADQDLLNPLGINALRRMPPGDDLVWGGRTLVGDDEPQWRYVAVRRTALFIERSLTRGLAWTATEPNGEPLWAAVRGRVQTFLHDLWRRSAFQGVTAEQGYLLRCGLGVTMTPADVDAGSVILEVGFAPLKPAEFVILRLRLTAGGDVRADAFPGQERLAGLDLDDVERPAGQRAALERAVARAARRSTPSRRRRGAERTAPASGRGRRIVLAGPSGADKTLAARALAGELGTDVIRVDLGQITSEYLAETERNLGRLLADAAATGALLFFDEADALFGRRSGVRDADDRAAVHDRRLFARLEDHPGVVIFATEDAAATREAAAGADAVVRVPRPRRWPPSA